jgi:thymidylate kinase
MKKYVIALTGCPTSGKSSVLRMLKALPTNNTIKVMFLDETATVFLHNRPAAVSALDSQLLRQHYILKAQMHYEDILLANAADAERPTLLITDRGCADAMVYLSDDEFPIFEIEPDSLYTRYDHVIFLTGNSQNFCADETTTRLETDYDQIAALGKRSYEIWSKHPSFTVIEQQKNVEEKTKLVTEKINEILGIKVF